MKKNMVRLSILFAIGAALLLTLLVSVSSARALETRQLLETGLARIDIPEPGDIVHYSYLIYERMPPQELEPKDPYHKPYAEIWETVQFEETWLEIGQDGKTVWWRTQLRNADGDLIQDLMFDGKTETDYFPFDFMANRFPQETSAFRDDRAALIEDFLNNEDLSRHDRIDLDGKPVIAIYAKERDLKGSTWMTQSIEEALSSFPHPFVVDLTPVATAIRIDFSPSDLVPVGLASVVFDKQGNETIVSYRTLSDGAILTDAEAESAGIFDQGVPEKAFSGTLSLDSNANLTSLDLIIETVDFTLFAIPDATEDTELTSASFNPAGTPGTVPISYQTIQFADALGVGVNLIYSSGQGTVSLMQGPTDELGALLHQTVPSWVRADYSTLSVGEESYTAWELVGLDANQRQFIIETGETLIYVNSYGLTREQLIEFLKFLRPLK
jgi:hypothetical protein